MFGQSPFQFLLWVFGAILHWHFYCYITLFYTYYIQACFVTFIALSTISVWHKFRYNKRFLYYCQQFAIWHVYNVGFNISVSLHLIINCHLVTLNSSVYIRKICADEATSWCLFLASMIVWTASLWSALWEEASSASRIFSRWAKKAFCWMYSWECRKDRGWNGMATTQNTVSNYCCGE